MSAVYKLERELRSLVRQSETTGKKIFPITVNEEDVLYVASVYPLPLFAAQDQFSTPPIPACEHELRDVRANPQKYPPAIMPVYGCYIANDTEAGFVPEYIPAEERAKDIAQKFGDFGVFAVDDPKKIDKAMVADAVAKLEAKFETWVNMNDEAWRDHGTLVKYGNSLGYLAARHFGLDKPWALRAGDQAICRFCQRAIKAGVWKCSHADCQAVLDWEAAYEAGHCTKEEMTERLKMQRERAKAASQKEVEL